MKNEYSRQDEIMRRQFQSVLELAQRVRCAADVQHPLLFAVDGRCGSGKSTLAAYLGRQLGCPVFRMDDFYLPFEQRTPQRMEQPGGHMDVQRLIAEVLEPFRHGEAIAYRAFDCSSGTCAPPVRVPAVPFAVAEGSYALLPELRGYYAASVFVTCPEAEQRRRLLLREGTQRFGMFEERWIPLEERYFKAQNPQQYASLVLDTGAGV